ncbi:MAG: 1-acyl-sn-glycerol-3-phosphate acyltransferase [Candidatus Hydrogenedentes bacterium]|nr:1-acyl-sn-glycerol-3-phosphate acyltransferase [Candidatus Hydrogenedentota bacterium]
MMPSHLRAIVRILLLVLFSVAMLLLRLLVWPTALVSRRTDRRLRRLLLKFWAFVYAAIAGIRIVAEGAAPKPPFFMVMNHLTYFDMLVLARETGCIFVSREDVADWPLFGFIAKSLYIIFINRSLRRDTLRVNALIAETIKEGDGIAVFAESRVSCGMTVEPFKSPLLQAAIDLNLPVYYAALNYRTPEGSPPEGEIVSWWRPEPFYVHQYRFLKYPGATATIRFGEHPLFDADRKVLARRLHEGVLSLFTPLRLAAGSYAGEAFPVEVQLKSAGMEPEAEGVHGAQSGAE